MTEQPGRYTLSKGKSDFVISDTDSGQLAYSESSTNIEGGSLGWRRGPQLPSIIADKIQQMKAGEVSEPIRTPSGFHLFRLNELRGGQQQAVVAQVHARHILLKTSELEDDQTVQTKLASIRERVLNGGEDFAAIAAVTSQDSSSAADGGDLGWAGPGSFVPDFEKQLDSLKENEISQPFQTQYGWHIVQLLGRRDHDATEDVKRQHAFAELCRDFRTIGIFRQREAASESAKGSLDAMEFLFLIFLLAFAFSGNAKNAVFDCYPNVILFHFRQVSFEEIPLIILTDVNLR